MKNIVKQFQDENDELKEKCSNENLNIQSCQATDQEIYNLKEQVLDLKTKIVSLELKNLTKQDLCLNRIKNPHDNIVSDLISYTNLN